MAAMLCVCGPSVGAILSIEDGSILWQTYDTDADVPRNAINQNICRNFIYLAKY